MKLIIDMNMSPKWADFLEKAGFEASHWSSIGAAKTPDAEIMEYARVSQCIILTEDLDFGSMLAMTNRPGPSVMQVRLQDARPALLGPRIILILRQMESELIRGALVTVGPKGSRLRMLPLRPIE